jgi:hypothetical protein
MNMKTTKKASPKPAPAAKGGRGKPYYAPALTNVGGILLGAKHCHPDNQKNPVFVLPADAASVEQMAVTLSKDRARRFKHPNLWMCYLPHARADLASLGLLPLKGGK